MDKQLIANWNSVVRPEDEVYHLGDLFFKCSVGYAHNILDQLNGKITVICGNHDKIIRNQKPLRDRFHAVYGYEKEVDVILSIPLKPWTEQRMCMSHYKMQTWNKSHYGCWHIYGHSHGSQLPCNSLSVNVCVDLWEYIPIHEAKLAGYFEELAKNWTPPFGKEKRKGHVEHF